MNSPVQYTCTASALTFADPSMTYFMPHHLDDSHDSTAELENSSRAIHSSRCHIYSRISLYSKFTTTAIKADSNSHLKIENRHSDLQNHLTSTRCLALGA
jgi:hypothetical protein